MTFKPLPRLPDDRRRTANALAALFLSFRAQLDAPTRAAYELALADLTVVEIEETCTEVAREWTELFAPPASALRAAVMERREAALRAKEPPNAMAFISKQKLLGEPDEARVERNLAGLALVRERLAEIERRVRERGERTDVGKVMPGGGGRC